MDLLSPSRLQDLCISRLARNGRLDILWMVKNRRLGFIERDLGTVEWRDPEQFLHSPLADRLLEFISRHGILADGILSTFTQEHVCLRNVTIHYCHLLTECGLQVLSHHKLVFFDLTFTLRLNSSVCHVLQYIGNKSCESLQHLILRKPKFRKIGVYWPGIDGQCGQAVIETLSRFNCLKRVDVRDTDVQNTTLAILGKSLLHVENLNLSMNDRITDISPLKNCQKTLKSLSLCGLRYMTSESAMATFLTLTGLTYLDVSLGFWIARHPYDYEEYDSFAHRYGGKEFTADKLLQMPDILPNLECLDLSGRAVKSEHALSQFLDAHQPLQKLMLWRSAACQFKSLQEYRPRLTVGGDASLEQYVAVLSHLTRIDQHQRNCFESSRRQHVMDKLIKHLQEKHFPPCGDDHLVQVVLDMLPSRCNLHCVQEYWFLGRYCLETVFLLLEKGIITRLEPDTKEYLLLLCHRARGPIRRRYVMTWQNEVHQPAEKIINALG